MVMVRCPHCGHEWNFKSNSLYAMCPYCMKRSKLEKCIEEKIKHLMD